MQISNMANCFKPHVSSMTNYISILGHVNYAEREVHILRFPGLPLVNTGYPLNFRYSLSAVKFPRP